MEQRSERNECQPYTHLKEEYLSRDHQQKKQRLKEEMRLLMLKSSRESIMAGAV